MNYRHHVSMTAFVAGLVAWSAGAQQEQWLEYHNSNARQGYKWLEVSTNRPANVALPKDLRASACFGSWKSGMDKDRWFALDRPGKAGSYDRLFFDLNGDGSLADETPVKANSSGGNTAEFAPCKILFKGEDGPVTYHLALQSYEFDGGRIQVLASAAGWYEGMVSFGPKKYRVQLRDNTINGAFNDNGPTPSESDTLFFPGSPSMTRYVGKYLEVDGQLYSLEVSKDGAFVKVKKAEAVSLGKVQVPETISAFEAIGDAGSFQRTPSKGSMTLPAGHYRVMKWAINRKDAKGVSHTLTGSGFSSAADFVVSPTETAVLRIGEPIRPQLEASPSKTMMSFSLRMAGSMGETVDIMRGTERPRAPQLQLVSLAGNYRSTNSFEYG